MSGTGNTLLLLYDNEQDFLRAWHGLHDAGVKEMETYTPYPIEEIASGRGSWVPGAMGILGIGGAVGGFLIQAYANTISYPVNIGGRPPLSWPAFIPVAFEIGALTAVVTGLFGYLLASALGTLSSPIDAVPGFSDVTDHRYAIVIRRQDAERVRGVLHDAPAVLPVPEAA